MLSLEVAILSEPGGRSHNEDACGHWHSDTHLCCALCDGAGGHGGGDLAAKLGVGHLIRAFAAAPTRDGPGLNRLIRQTNQAVIEARVPHTESAQMHSTVVCLALDFMSHRVHWAHAGDSRLYWFRGRRLLQRTRDHSMVQSLIDAGLLDEGALRRHPKRSQLRSALGTDASLLQVAHSGAAREVMAGDIFLLCSDGVWELIEDSQLERLLAHVATPRAWLAAIEATVRRAAAGSKGHDNFTALTVWAREPDAKGT